MSPLVLASHICKFFQHLISTSPIFHQLFFISRGTYLSDLTFTEDGNADTFPNVIDPTQPFINFTKRDLIWTILQQIELYQQTPFKIPSVEPLRTILLELPSLDEKDLYALSLNLEPRK